MQLWDGQTNPNSDGRISIQNRGELIILGEYSFTGSGYFHLAEGARVHGPGAFRIRRGDVTTSVANKDLRRLVLQGGANIQLDPGQHFSVEQAGVQANGGTIRVSNGGTVKVGDAGWTNGGPAFHSDGLGEVIVTASRFKGGDGPEIYVADRSQLATVEITGTEFIDTEYGISFLSDDAQVTGRSRPRVSNCSFNGGYDGIDFSRFRSAYVSDCSFNGLGHAAVTLYEGLSISISDCTIDGEGVSVYGVLARLGSQASLNGGTITKTSTGVWGEGDSEVQLRECIAVTENPTGLSGNETTYLLAGLSLTKNAEPIRGTDVFITRGTYSNGSLIQNTLGRDGGTHLVDIDYTGTPPLLDLSYNGWQQDGVAAFPDDEWFCVRENGSDCIDNQVNFTHATEGYGCGIVPPPACPKPPCAPACPADDPFCFRGPGGTVTATTLRVWPNPNPGTTASVSFTTGGGRLSIVDVLGRELYAASVDPTAEYQEVPTSTLSPGTYFLHLLRPDGIRQTQSFTLLRP